MEKYCVLQSFLIWHKLFYSDLTSRIVWHLTSTTVFSNQWIIERRRKRLTLLSSIFHRSFFSFLSLNRQKCVSACSCSSARLLTHLLASLNQTLKALISLQLCLEKGSIRYFKKQQWILRPLVRYSVSKTSVVCLTISATQTKRTNLLASCATLIDLQVMKTLHKTRNGATEDWR